MKKFDTSPISGTQELLPRQQREFDLLKSGIEAAFRAHGYQHIETPVIERMETLLAKAGGETEKQIYKVVKTSETADDASQALRFDHTVPLARYVAEHLNDLAFPFKVTQVARNFRGERPQRGRFREFYQCDIDVIGRNRLPIYYDADVIMTLVGALAVLPLSNIVVRVSNRKLLSGLLEELNLQHHAAEIFSIIDHAEKVPPEATCAALTDLGIGSESVTKILAFSQISGAREAVIPKLRDLGFANATFQAGLAELDEVLGLLEQRLELSRDLSIKNTDPAHQKHRRSLQHVQVVADMLIVRGLDYYTGTVFETVVPERREIGSICSGGRYDNLASNYTDQVLPGIGGSIGLTRLFYILQSYDLMELTQTYPVDYCLIPLTMQELMPADRLAEQLRTRGKTVDVLVSDKKIGQKLSQASKMANFAIVVGEAEVQQNQFTVKNLTTGEQYPLEI